MADDHGGSLSVAMTALKCAVRPSSPMPANPSG
jgi:hypothetical protein